MPTPNAGESKEHFMGRCIPYVLNEGTAENEEQAAAICYSIWEKHKSGKGENMADEIIRHWQAGLPVLKFDDNDLRLTHFITTEHVDRYGEVVLADGAEIPPNGVRVLWQHGMAYNRDVLPIGKPLTIGPDTYKGVNGLVAETQFYKPGTDKVFDQFPALLYDMHKQGILDGWSIGFRSKLSEPRAVKLDGKDEDVELLHYVKWVLMEYSSVAVPANPYAMNKSLTQAVKDGRLTQEELEHWIGRECRDYGQCQNDEAPQQAAEQPSSRGVIELLGAMTDNKEG